MRTALLLLLLLATLPLPLAVVVLLSAVLLLLLWRWLVLVLTPLLLSRAGKCSIGMGWVPASHPSHPSYIKPKEQLRRAIKPVLNR